MYRIVVTTFTFHGHVTSLITWPFYSHYAVSYTWSVEPLSSSAPLSSQELIDERPATDGRGDCGDADAKTEVVHGDDEYGASNYSVKMMISWWRWRLWL